MGQPTQTALNTLVGIGRILMMDDGPTVHGEWVQESESTTLSFDSITSQLNKRRKDLLKRRISLKSSLSQTMEEIKNNAAELARVDKMLAAAEQFKNL